MQLANGEKAVVIARGAKANQPHVASIIDAAGMPLSRYNYRDTREAPFAIRLPINAEHIKVLVNPDKVARIRTDHLR